jgi:hypothetical protein
MVETFSYLGEPALVIIAILTCAFFAVRIMRSRMIPFCVCCGSKKVRPGQLHGFWDSVADAFLVRRHRCDGCMKSFYAVLLFGTAKHILRPERALKITFLRRQGAFVGVVINRIDLEPAHLRRGRRSNRKPGSISESPAVFQT